MTDSAVSKRIESAKRARVIGFLTKPVRNYLLLWSFFFLICAGLGYPTLSRFRPPNMEGLSDTNVYYRLVTDPPNVIGRKYMRCRVLIPFVARPFYSLASRFFKRWDPIAFGLLVSNSLFCALGACLLVSLGYRVAGDATIAILGATVYLLNFAVPNLQLVGLIDSGEACFMLAITWSLLAEKWYMLPVWGVLGTLAKETFVPFALVFTTVWWISGEFQARSSARNCRLKWTVALAVSTVTTLIALHSIIAGQIVWPWNIAAEANAKAPFLPALLRSVTDRGFWYIFVWLLPLGLWKLSRFPRPWLMASVFTAATALVFGAWKDMAGNVARPLFNTVGPMLSLSTAILLAGRMAKPRSDLRNDS